MGCLMCVLALMAVGNKPGRVQAANGSVYTCQIVPCYAHPVTGEIEDSGGEASYATGQGMVESAVYTTGIMEVLDDGTFYLTIRLSLMDYTSGHNFWVQNVGDSGWSTPALGVTNTGSDSNGSTADICIQVPSENCVVRGSMYVDPMGRDVVFYFYPTNYVAGNSTNMLSTMIVEDTPAAGGSISGSQSLPAQTQDGTQETQAQSEAQLGTGAMDALQSQTEGQSEKDGAAQAEEAMDAARGLRMSMDLDTAKEETNASAEGIKIVAASAQIAEICEKLDLPLAGVCAEDASQVPERYANVVITETEEEARLDKIKALEPDWILDAASQKAERQDAYDKLDADWAFLNLDSVAGMYRSVSELGEIFGKDTEAKALTDELGTFYNNDTTEKKDTKAVILVATKDGCKIATDTSYLGNLLSMAGLTCAYTENDSEYKTLDLDVLAQTDCSMIFRTSSGMTKEEADAFWKDFETDEKWQGLSAVQNGAVKDLDGEKFDLDADLSWQEALTTLKDAIG